MTTWLYDLYFLIDLDHSMAGRDNLDDKVKEMDVQGNGGRN